MKPIYNRKGWILARCVKCLHLNYVEPHGTTAECKRCHRDTEHQNIPMSERDFSGLHYRGPARGRVA